MKFSRQCWLIFAALVAPEVFASNALAVDYNWDGSSSALFTDGNNWTPVGVPGAADTAILRLGNVPVYPVWLFQGMFVPIDRTVDQIIVGTNTVSFAGGVLTADRGFITETGRGLIIGQTASDVAVVNSSLQGFSTVYGTLGSAAGASGTLNLGSGRLDVTGAAATFDLIVGLNGTGAINVSGGADVDVADDVAVGQNSTAIGTVSVSGNGSSWSSDLMYVGYFGQGTLNISSLADVSTTTGSIGGADGSSGDVNVNFSTWTNSTNLYVGFNGEASLDITGEGYVTTATGYIGTHPTSTGAVTVNGGGSTLETTGDLIVGNSGNGTLDVTNGGDVISNNGYIANLAGSTGEVTIVGNGATWTNAANLYVGNSGNGTLNITAGGDVLTGGDSYTGTNAGSYGEANVDGAGSTWTTAGTLYVKNAGNAFIHVTNGGQVTSGTTYIGDDAGSSAEVTVGGVGAKLTTAGTLHVGDPGTGIGAGTLNVERSGTVEVGVMVSINSLSTVNLKSNATLDGDVANAGLVHVTGPADVSGSLNNAVGANTLIDWAEPLGVVVLDVGGNIANSGMFTMTINHAEPLGVAALHVGGTTTNSGTFSLMIDYAEPLGIVAMDAADNITNSGTFTVESAVERDVTLQLAAGKIFTNNASGVVNLNGPADVNGDNMISGKHIIAGDVVNNGKLNVRGNTRVEGTLTTADGSETNIESTDECCVELAVGRFVNNGTITFDRDSIQFETVKIKLGAGENLTNNSTGAVKGTGTIEGNLVNHGRVEPGNSAGMLTVTGDYTQASDGTLVFDVAGTTAGTDYDQLVIGGDISLDGVVQVVFPEEFVPRIGSKFQVITTAEPPHGIFAGASLPGLPAGMDWGIDYGPDAVSLAIGIPGDYNANGKVDAADYTVWHDTLGLSGVFLAADGDNSGTIDDGDYDFWKTHFGDGFPGLGAGGGAVDPLLRVPASADPLSAAAPEPSAIMLLAVGIVGLLWRREWFRTGQDGRAI